ncbi:response regulator [Muricauda sp. JGD-17]|uniref:Response regulator n=1 Tax=Flagellimonas ochracea TaxID=2696472 RepID=A0A964TF33_9FLAO|nr:response regulator [Allomuricauda ochracea]
MKGIIVDDEPIARKRISNLINDFSDELVQISAECGNAENAISCINKIQPQIIFLDIKMKDMTGFDVIRKMKVKAPPVIIFTTAYDQYALQAFDFFAFDFLLKPFKDDRFYQSLRRSIEHIKKSNANLYEKKLNDLISYVKAPNANQFYSKKERLLIKLGNKATIINTNDIKYIVANGYYAEIFTNQKKYVLRTSLTKLTNQLDPNCFIRIHRSTIVNINMIQEVVFSDYGEIDTKMLDMKLFRVSKSNKKTFLSKLGAE